MKKKLETEIIEILMASKVPLSVENITHLSTLTRHESRVNPIVMRLAADGAIQSTDINTKADLHYYIED